MKAFVVTHYGPDGLKAADVPAPSVGPRDVLVDIRAASINPLDKMVRNGEFKQLLKYKRPFVLDSLGAASLEKSLTVLEPGGLAISVVGPPDPAFAAQLGQPLLKPVMAVLSRKVRRRARKLGVRYSFFFMQASGAQLASLAALYDAGTLRPVLDRTFPFDRTLDAMAYVEQGKAAGKIVVTR